MSLDSLARQTEQANNAVEDRLGREAQLLAFAKPDISNQGVDPSQTDNPNQIDIAKQTDAINQKAIANQIDYTPFEIGLGGTAAGGTLGAGYGLVADSSVHVIKDMASALLGQPKPAFSFEATKLFASRGALIGAALGAAAAVGYYEVKKHNETGSWF